MGGGRLSADFFVSHLNFFIMASLKVLFRRTKGESLWGVLYIRLTHGRTSRFVSTGIRVTEDEWDERGQCFRRGIVSSRARYLSEAEGKVRDELGCVKGCLESVARGGLFFTVDEVMALYRRRKKGAFVGPFMAGLQAELAGSGRKRMAEMVESALRSFMLYRGGRDLVWGDFNGAMVSGYVAFLRSRGCCENTVAFYLRVLRLAYNRAVCGGLADDCRPFRGLRTDVVRTRGRAVPLRVIGRLRDLDCGSDADLSFARDLFLFSFYARGMSFVDMAFLRKSDLRNGVLWYRRRKTGVLLSIRWERCLDVLVRRLGDSGNGFLLPIIREGKDCRREYLRVLGVVNRGLKRLTFLTGSPICLTSYVARHSWADAALRSGVPMNVISRGLGHESERTTRIYLSTLDDGAVDRANRRIINSL